MNAPTEREEGAAKPTLKAATDEAELVLGHLEDSKVSDGCYESQKTVVEFLKALEEASYTAAETALRAIRKEIADDDKNHCKAFIHANDILALIDNALKAERTKAEDGGK